MTETPTETRERILDEYGWIWGITGKVAFSRYGPGKFESEPIFAPYFYEQMQDGFGESMYEANCDCDDPTCMDLSEDCDHESQWIGDVLDITDEDREVWPELDSEARFVSVFTSEQGFAYVTTHETDPRMVTA